jgi:hypothetical protein
MPDVFGHLLAMVMKPSPLSNSDKVIYLRAKAPAVGPRLAEGQSREKQAHGKQDQASAQFAHKHPTATTESAVIQLERELLAAIKEKNLSILNQLLAHDFVYRSPYTKDLAKNDFLDSIQASNVEINKIWFGEMKVSVLDKIVLINGVQKAQLVEPDGNVVVHQTAFSDVFVYRHGRWLLISSYGVEMPEL